MSLKGVLLSLNQKLDSVEALYKRTDVNDFNQYTILIGQLAPLFKQAEVFEFLCEGNNAEAIPDKAILLKQCPYLVFPEKIELDSLKEEVRQFYQRALPLSEKINAHGHQHAAKKNDETLQSSLNLEILAMYLRVMLLPESASSPDERTLIHSAIRSSDDQNQKSKAAVKSSTAEDKQRTDLRL